MIELKKVCFKQEDFSLADLDFEVPFGEYAIIMGKTGSGKTTLLEILCGLRFIKSGKIFLNHKDVTNLKPALRQIGYVPQDAALFPTMNIAENLGFALKLKAYSKVEITIAIQEMAEDLSISHLLNRYPNQLSGGERQRVALGRAILSKPKLLLLDEPLSALDLETQQDLCQILKKTCMEHRLTTLHVTHNSEEAKQLGDRIYKLQDGRIHSGSSIILAS